MTSVANHALEKLLRRAENALAKGPMNRIISINFTDKSFPAYLKLETFAEKEACNGELRLAERDGAIKVVWDERAGVEKHIGQIVLDDPVALAKFLGINHAKHRIRSQKLIFWKIVEKFAVLALDQSESQAGRGI